MRNAEVVWDGSGSDTPADRLRPHEECGVFGACLDGEASLATYYGLIALQHRGQEGAGIAAFSEGVVRAVKGPGLASEVFRDDALRNLPGATAIGHVRNSREGEFDSSGLQPHVFRYVGGMMAVALNGRLTNGEELRQALGRSGVVFQSSSDSELIGILVARHYELGLAGAIEKTMEEIRGGYAFVVMAGDAVYAARDPHGIRPLVVGRAASGWVVASESCALDAVGAVDRRDVGRGEIVSMTRESARSTTARAARRASTPATCSFEYIYFARPDSVIDGVTVGAVRRAMGARLAREAGIDADVVIPVPESGVSAALGFAAESGIPYEQGLTKNRYLGRTFIRPSQAERELGVRLKLNAVERSCAGKRVVLVDDSIVRGTTSARLIDLMRKTGAREVHLAVSSPPIVFPCRYGIDTSERDELIAVDHSLDEVTRKIGADSVCYLSLEGLIDTIRSLSGARDFGCCTACLGGGCPDDVRCSCYDASASPERTSVTPTPVRLSYRASGVDIDEGERAVSLMKPAVKSTFTSGVLGDIGGFGGLYRIDSQEYEEPVLVSGTDGVGTKLKIAFAMDKHDTIGIDAVAMCVNDILVSGAKPLFFLDYIGCGKLDADMIAQIVGGVAEGCRQAGCALVGGETAEMPGFYPEGEYDIAGFAVGVVDRRKIIDGSSIAPGDVIVGLASSGIHSNGFSLARASLLGSQAMLLSDLPDVLEGRSLGEELLTPTRIYVRSILALTSQVNVVGMAHITGGGLVENPPRMLPGAGDGHGQGASIQIDLDSWKRPPVFDLIQSAGNVEMGEMLRVFNMGIGFMVVVKPDDARRTVEILRSMGEDARVIGRVIPGDGSVVFKGRGCEGGASVASGSSRVGPGL